MKKPLVFNHLVLAMVASLILFFAYLAIQQNYRSSANDPQTQLAQYIQSSLENNVDIAQLIPPESLDLEKSLAVFFMAYDNNGKLITTTGLVDGKQHPLPIGTLSYATETDPNQFTWQPKEGVRMAMTVIKVNSPKVAYLAIGRSLKEIEKRTSNLLKTTIFFWLFAMGIVAISLSVCLRTQRTKE